MKKLIIILLLVVSSVGYAQVRPTHVHELYTMDFHGLNGHGTGGYYIPYTSSDSSATISGVDGNGTAYNFTWEIRDSTLTYSFVITPGSSNVVAHYINLFDYLTLTDYFSTEDYNSYSSELSYQGSVNLGNTYRAVVFNFDFRSEDATYYSITQHACEIHYKQPESDWEE